MRDRQSFAQQERSEQEAFLRERERQKALHQMFGKKVRYLAYLYIYMYMCTPGSCRAFLEQWEFTL